MVRSTIPACFAAVVATAGLFVVLPAHAQLVTPAVPEPYKFSDGKVSIHTVANTDYILQTLLREMKVPFVIGAISFPERVSDMTMNVDNVPVERALSIVCAASTPRLRWEKEGDVYLVTVASPATPPAAPVPPAPQVHVTNNLPQPDALAASLAVTGPNAIDTVLELRLLSLQTERQTLQVDFSDNSPQLKRNEAEIKAVEQLVVMRRAQKQMKPQIRKAATPPRPQPVRKVQGG